jgi:hypothetical protein
MKTKDVIEHFGDIKKTAAALDITTQAIYSWGEEVPKSRQAHVELATRGKVKRTKVGQ